VVIKNEVANGQYDIEHVSLKRIRDAYADK